MKGSNGTIKWLLGILGTLFMSGIIAVASISLADHSQVAVNDQRIDGVEESLAELKAEVRREFAELKALIRDRR